MSVEEELKTVDHKFWVDYFELKNGRIKVFRRKNVSNKFYARFTFRDQTGYVQESLKTTDIDEAATIALEKYLQYEFRKKQGLAVKSKPFDNIANEYIQFLKAQLERKQIKKAKFDNRRLMIARYFIAFFEDTLIGDIKRPQIEAYREWRQSYWVNGPGSKKRRNIYERNGKTIRSPISNSWKGRVPTTSTLNSEETALRSIFKFAINRGYLADNEMPVIRTENITWKPRSTFSDKEYTKLLNAGRRRIRECEEAKREREAHQRFMVYQYVLIAANCGARVTELMNLKWRDITWEDKDSSGHSSILFDVAGKSKYRTLVANDECREYLLRIKDRMKLMAEKYSYKLDEKNGYVFTDYRGRKVGSFKKAFNAWMVNAEVIEDKDGNKRCLGSLRIFYATMRLLKGDHLDLYDLALQMGTSVQMLQKTYSRLTARLRASKIKKSPFVTARSIPAESQSSRREAKPTADETKIVVVDADDPRSILSGSSDEQDDEQSVQTEKWER
jgi:integrase